jgi:hypothetical protein
VFLSNIMVFDPPQPIHSHTLQIRTSRSNCEDNVCVGPARLKLCHVTQTPTPRWLRSGGLLAALTAVGFGLMLYRTVEIRTAWLDGRRQWSLLRTARDHRMRALAAVRDSDIAYRRCLIRYLLFCSSNRHSSASTQLLQISLGY